MLCLVCRLWESPYEIYKNLIAIPISPLSNFSDNISLGILLSP